MKTTHLLASMAIAGLVTGCCSKPQACPSPTGKAVCKPACSAKGKCSGKTSCSAPKSN